MGKGVWITVIVILLVLIAGFFVFKNYGQSQNTNTGVQQGTIAQGSQGMGSETQQNGSSSGSSGSTGIETSPKTYDVTIKSYEFQPAMLTIKTGDTVVWANKDSVPHTVTSDSGSELNSGTLGGASSGGYYSASSSGGSYSHTFATAGTYSYHCSYHTHMMGKIVVE